MEARPELVRLASRRRSRLELVAVLAVVAFGAGIVGLGLTGERPDVPAPPPSRAPSTTNALPTAPAASRPTPSAPTIAFPLAGYAVHAALLPVLLDADGSLAVYGSGRDEVVVSVGTPGRPAALPGPEARPGIYARTLDRLGQAYLAAADTRLHTGEALVVDGEDGWLFRLAPADAPRPGSASMLTAVALFAVDQRAFVITSPREEALRAFLEGLTFGPPLFVSRALGFHAPQLVDVVPFGTWQEGERRGDVVGLYVFSDGVPAEDAEFSHSIAVSVGTAAMPAYVRALPSALPPPRTRRIWASTLSGLVRAYRSAVDTADGLSVPTTLGGVPAMLLLRADGLAATVLAVHEGRAFIVSTTGHGAVARAPHFEEFLAAFSFLD